MPKRLKPLPKEPFYHFVKKKGWIVLDPTYLCQKEDGSLWTIEVRKPKKGELYFHDTYPGPSFYKDGRPKIKRIRSYLKYNDPDTWEDYQERNYIYNKEYYAYVVIKSADL